MTRTLIILLATLAAMISTAHAAAKPERMLQGKPTVTALTTVLPQIAKPQQIQPIQVAGKRWRRRGRRVGAGLAIIGIIGLAAAAAARESERDRDYEHERQCRKWLRRCDRGNDRACWNFDEHC